MPGPAAPSGLPTRHAEAVRGALSTGDIGLALRVPAFSVVTVTLGVGAHLAAGGAPPTAVPLLVIAAVLMLAGRLIALKEQSLIRLTASVWVVQSAIHVTLMATHAHAARAHLTGLHLPGAHVHGMAGGPGGPLPKVALVGTSAAEAAPTIATGQLDASMHAVSTAEGRVGMLAFHALAGLAVAAWLRRGEAAVWNAARRVVPRLPCPGAQPVRREHRTVPVCTAPRIMQAGALLLVAGPRRGPPPLPA